MNLHIGMYSGNRMPVGNQMVIGSHASGKDHKQTGSQITGQNQGKRLNQMLFGDQIRSGKSQQSSQNFLQMKRMLGNSTGQKNAQSIWGQRKSIVDEMTGYSDTIRANREKAKNTSLEMKKLQYSYTSVSSRILSSKTSVSARQAAGQARREVFKLQKKRGNSEYDQEELEAAITHAKAMERLAKKKARHLEEEELAKVGGACMGELEEKEELRGEDETQEDEEISELTEEDYADAEELLEAEAEEISDAEIDSMSLEEMEAFLDEMQQSMQDLLEESGMNDLFEELTETPSGEMDPADYKMMKIKHRCKEMKDLVKADAEYLKVIFKKLEASRGKAIEGFKGTGSAGTGNLFSGAPSGGGMPAVTVHVDIPVSDVASAPSGDAPTVDVSV